MGLEKGQAQILRDFVYGIQTGSLQKQRLEIGTWSSLFQGKSNLEVKTEMTQAGQMSTEINFLCLQRAEKC